VNGLALEFDDVRERFAQRVVPRTSRAAQLILKSAEVRALERGSLMIALPTEEMRLNTEMITQGLRSALEHEFKVPLGVEWIVDPSLVVAVASAPRSTPRPTPPPAPVAEDAYGADESVVVVQSAADHLITEMFPGAEEIT
jgi:hypothetical protein